MLTASDELWDVAVRQAAVIGRLAALDSAGVTAVGEAAAELGLSRRQVYVLLGRWRAGEGVVSDLLPGRSSGGRGGSRVPNDVEVIVRQVLQARYRTPAEIGGSDLPGNHPAEAPQQELMTRLIIPVQESMA